MTRTYATIQLLRHGPLSMREFIEITGWPITRAHNAIRWLLETKTIKRIGKRKGRGVYRLYDWSQEL